MVQEAEKYKAEDYVNKNRVEAIGSEELKDKIPANEKSKPDAAIDGTITWLDANAESEKEEFEEKQKAALKAIANPILQSVAGGAGMPGGMPDMGCMPDKGGAPSANPAGGPTIEEIDSVNLRNVEHNQ